MRLYYSDAFVMLYHGDCREVLPHVSADVLATDPPFGVGLVRKTSDYRDSPAFDAGASLQASTLYDDDPDRVRSMLREAIPLALSRVRRGVVFCGTAAMWTYPEPASVGCVFTPNGAGRSAWGFQCMHPVLFYGKDPFLQDGLGGRPNSWRTEQPNRENIDHPCPKPLDWMRWAITRASRDGESILDPFCGSGTTLRAAKDLGRRSIGIDIEERYCEIAAKRLSQEVFDFGNRSA